MRWKGFWEKLTNWELWPFKLRYLPITPVWLWYCMRARSFWFFTPSNPTITFGGFEGEGKKEMYDQLKPGSFPKTIYIHPAQSFEQLKEELQKHHFTYPFCVKPDVGMKGLCFRKIDNEAQLKYYHERIPVEYIIQDLAEQPLEVSVFYYRFPDQLKGRISGFIQKELMDVIGDGQRSLLQLVQEHPKAKHRMEEMQVKHGEHFEKIIPNGERYILTYAANLNRGAKFTNLESLIDDTLLKIFDDISHQTPFYYGRYDLKCDSIEELKKGNFIILEFNGSGAEPNHVYNCNYSWFAALKVFLHHWKVLFKISMYNRRQGIKFWSFKRGWRFLKEAKKHFKILEKADTDILV